MAFLEFLNRNILDVPFWLSLAVLVVTLALEFFRARLLVRHASRIFLYGTFLIFVYFIYIGFLQFVAFKSGVLGSILGTKGTFLWFLDYVRLHYWNDYLISLPVAILFALVGYYFNKKYNERFFEKEELFLIAIGILFVGYPGFFFYIPLVLLASIIASAIFVKRGERLPLYHFWMPTAVAALFAIHFWASSQSWWNQFRF